MRSDHFKSLCCAAVVFILLICTGFALSRHKLLWIDECFTQHVSVNKPSYVDILTLNFPDGNKCPLFYIMQKASSDMFAFRYPVRQAEGSFDVSDVHSQIIIRIPSNVCMSLGLAAIFYYLTRFFSLGAALYGLAVALVSPLVWLYWVEARPYSLWFLLTTSQLLFFCSTVHHPKTQFKLPIGIINVLLLLTTPGSIFQVTIITLLLFLRGKYKKHDFIWAWCLPAAIFLVYYFLVPVYKFKTFGLIDCLLSVVTPEHVAVYVLYALAAWVFAEKRKESSNTFFLPVFLLFLISACIALLMNLFTVKYQFNFHNRYLIYLVPADILMFTFVGIDFWKWARGNNWVRLNIAILLAGLVIVRGLMTYREILATALYLHSPGRI